MIGITIVDHHLYRRIIFYTTKFLYEKKLVVKCQWSWHIIHAEKTIMVVTLVTGVGMTMSWQNLQKALNQSTNHCFHAAHYAEMQERIFLYVMKLKLIQGLQRSVRFKYILVKTFCK